MYLKYGIDTDALIMKIYSNFTQVWGAKIEGTMSKTTFTIDQYEQYLYMTEITSVAAFRLFILNWENGTIQHALQTNGVSGQYGWNNIILSDSSSKLIIN